MTILCTTETVAIFLLRLSSPAAADNATTTPPKNIHSEEISYAAGGAQLKSFLAYDAGQKGQRPGVLVVHEWWGHNDYARQRARMLAEMGYTALALDMYGDGKQAQHPGGAQKFMLEVFNNMAHGEARFAAAQKILQTHATTDSSRIAAIGYCFGGAVVLHMARRGFDLDGVASFHGNLSTQSPGTGAVRCGRSTGGGGASGSLQEGNGHSQSRFEIHRLPWGSAQLYRPRSN